MQQRQFLHSKSRHFGLFREGRTGNAIGHRLLFCVSMISSQQRKSLQNLGTTGGNTTEINMGNRIGSKSQENPIAAASASRLSTAAWSSYLFFLVGSAAGFDQGSKLCQSCHFVAHQFECKSLRPRKSGTFLGTNCWSKWKKDEKVQLHVFDRCT